MLNTDMELNDRRQLADLLRRAATLTVSEGDFWTEYYALRGRVSDSIVEVPLESATHYWGNFHQRSIFFLIPVRPDRFQLEQDRNELNLIAKGLEEGWEISVLEEKLKDI
jgi:hypothetical protein